MTLPWGSSRLDQAAAHVVGGGGGSSPFVFLVFAKATSPDSANLSTTNTPINTTGADLLIAVIADYQLGPALTITDNKGNTWAPLTAASISGSTRVQIHWSKPTTVGSGHFWDAVGSGSYSSIAVAAFSGCSNATPFDVQTTGTGTSATASAGSGITPTQNQELIIAGVGIGAGTVSSINSSFTIIASNASGAGVNYGGGLAYKIQSSAAAVDPDWTLSGSTDWAAVIASFKAV